MCIRDILFLVLSLVPFLILMLPSNWRYAPMDKPREGPWMQIIAFFRVFIPGEAEKAAYWGVSACYFILLILFYRREFDLVAISATAATYSAVAWIIRKYEKSTRYRQPLVSTGDPVDFEKLAGHLEINIEEKEKEYLKGAIATIKRLYKISNAPVSIERLLLNPSEEWSSEPDELLRPLWKVLDKGKIEAKISYQIFQNLTEAACREIRNENISRLEVAEGRRYIHFVIRKLFIERFKNEDGVYVFEEERFPLYRFLLGVPLIFDIQDERIEGKRYIEPRKKIIIYLT